MLFLGLSFILYVLQSSGRNSFWKNLRNTDITTHKSAIYVKAKLDIEFLKKGKSTDGYPKFVRYKHVKNKTRKEILYSYYKLYKANSKDTIKARGNNFRKLQQQHVDSQNQLLQSTWFEIP